MSEGYSDEELLTEYLKQFDKPPWYSRPFFVVPMPNPQVRSVAKHLLPSRFHARF